MFAESAFTFAEGFARGARVQIRVSPELHQPVGTWGEESIIAHDCESGYGFGAEAIGNAQKDGTDVGYIPLLSHLNHPLSAALLQNAEFR
jgi:hypothetical protein